MYSEFSNGGIYVIGDRLQGLLQFQKHSKHYNALLHDHPLYK